MQAAETTQMVEISDQAHCNSSHFLLTAQLCICITTCPIMIKPPANGKLHHAAYLLRSHSSCMYMLCVWNMHSGLSTTARKHASKQANWC
jgi:hypothetical protein